MNLIKVFVDCTDGHVYNTEISGNKVDSAIEQLKKQGFNQNENFTIQTNEGFVNFNLRYVKRIRVERS